MGNSGNRWAIACTALLLALGTLFTPTPAHASAHAVPLASEAPLPTAAAHPLAAPPRLTMSKCPSGGPSTLECGQLITAEQRRNPNSGTVSVAWARHRVKVKTTAKPPVVYVTSQGTAVRTSAQLLATGLFSDRDLIVVEPRGGATGDDTFTCPAEPAARLDLLRTEAVDAAARKAAVATYANSLRGCALAYTQDKHVMQGMAAIESAADVAELRGLLSVPAWYAMGNDWTTTIVLQAAVYDVQGILGVVTDGFSGPNLSTQRDAGLQESLKTISARTPDGPVNFANVVASYNQAPLNLPYTNPFTSAPMLLRLSGTDIAALMQEALRDQSVQPYAATWLQQVQDRDPAAVTNLVQRALPGLLDRDTALEWVYRCRQNNAAVQSAWLFSDADVKDVCKAIGVGPEGTVPTPAQPVLALVGAVNPLSSVGLTSAATKAIPTASTVVIAAGSDRLVQQNRCAQGIVRAWLNAPKAPPESACAKATTSADIEAKAAPRFAPQLALGTFSVWSVLLIPLLFALIAPVWTLAWVGGTVAALARRRGVRSALLSGIAPISSLLAVGGMAWLTWIAYRANDSIFLVGAPSGVTMWGLLLIPALLGVGALFAIKRWFDGFLAAIAVLAFGGWYAWAVLGIG